MKVAVLMGSDSDWNLIASWSELVDDYGFDIELKVRAALLRPPRVK